MNWQWAIFACVIVLMCGVYSEDNVEIPTKCPKVDSPGKVVQIAHESDCTKFYSCYGGQKIEYQCPPMDAERNLLHFNPKLQVCDWPTLAGCQNYISTGTAQTSIRSMFSIVGSDMCPSNGSKNGMFYPHELDCQKYYLCLKSELHLLDCPKNNYFNPKYSACDITTNVDCAASTSWTSKTIPTPTTQTPSTTQRPRTPKIPTTVQISSSVNTPPPDQCPKRDSPGKVVGLAHESDCTKFYICAEGRKMLMECPKSDAQGNRLHFNPKEQVCDWPASAGCASGTSISVGDSGTDETDYGAIPSNTASSIEVQSSVHPNGLELCPNDGSKNGMFYPHEWNCQKYYFCFTSKLYLHECPSNQYFNLKYFKCDEPENVNCTSLPPGTSSTAELSSTSEIPSTVQTPSTSQAPSTPQMSSTLTPSTSQTLSTPEISLSTPEASTAKISSTPEITTLPVTSTPEMTTLLLTSTPETTTLPVTTTRDISSTSTVVSTSPSVATTSSVPTTCPSKDPHQPVLIAHSENCTLYYKCVKGEKILEHCLHGFYFNPILQKCDWPEMSGCKVPITTTVAPSSVPPSSKKSKCPDTTFLTQIAHETNCSLYYECNNGKRMLRSCVQGLEFNPRLGVCDWLETAGCTLQLKPVRSVMLNPVHLLSKSSDYEFDGLQDTEGCIGNCSTEFPVDVVHLPHRNCRKFCKCSFGKPYVFTCPHKLHYNPDKEICDYPYQAGCTGIAE